ncbi:MerR family transcriptional regulator [Mesorhizobium xinjiangense]|uniref:MerR family transcriptional regulator n=1 Tax=Mesorhizobium xinjiangense TaxID=2678685 RepID=UPI0012EEA214|nr:MerR family DNA-binding transcriptional regulator [Mesorhizobium xinjiangense]
MTKSIGVADAATNATDTRVDGNAGSDRIGDLARAYGVSLRTLRFYEEKGLIHPRRVGNARLYSRRDRARLELILLGRDVGFSLREVKQMLDLYDPDSGNMRQMRVVLEKSERQLARLHKQREEIDSAIGQLKSAIGTLSDRLDKRRQLSAV